MYLKVVRYQVLSDGDIRRSLIKSNKIDTNACVLEVANKNPMYEKYGRQGRNRIDLKSRIEISALIDESNVHSYCH